MESPNQSLPSKSGRVLYGPVWAFFMHRLINPVMTFFLNRGMGAKTLMILEFTGRKTGKLYSLPVGYMQRDQTVYCYTPFAWWRNLVGGAPVALVIRGEPLTGIGNVSTDTAEIAAGMDTYLRHNPGDARFYKVKLDRNRHPIPEDIAKAAKDNVQIRIELDPKSPLTEHM